MFSALYLTSFLAAWMANLISISMALFLAQVKQSGPLIIGLAGFATSFASTSTTFFLARHSVRNRALIFFYAPLCIGILYFLVPFLSMPLVFLFLLCIGSLFGFFWPSMQKCFSGTGDEVRIGVFNLSWSSGVILGAFSAGIIFAVNPNYNFYTALLLSVCAFLSIMPKKDSLLRIGADAGAVRSDVVLPAKTIREVRLLNFITFFAASSVFALYPKLGLIRGFSPQFIGSVAGILLVSRLVFFFLLIDKPMLLHPARFVISCSIFFAGCCFVGMGNVPWIVILGVAMLGATGAFTYHNSLQMHIRCGLKTEIHEGIIGAGSFTGALTAGLLGQLFSLPVAYVIIGAGIFLTGLWHSRKYLTAIRKV